MVVFGYGDRQTVDNILDHGFAQWMRYDQYITFEHGRINPDVSLDPLFDLLDKTPRTSLFEIWFCRARLAGHAFVNFVLV